MAHNAVISNSPVKTDRAMMWSLTVPGTTGPYVAHQSRLIPKPDVPLRSPLSLGSFGRLRSTACPSVLDAGHVAYVTAGRIAIAIAFQRMGVNSGDEVLFPAFHCLNMVNPLRVVGAEPVFYKIHEDLSPDFDDIYSKLTKNTRVLMVPHYFGFHQNTQAIRGFCDDNKIKFLEDCAHCFFGSNFDRPVGAFGDYSIASLRKFFPVFDGGCVISPHEDMDDLRLNSQNLWATLEAGASVVATSVHYGRLAGMRGLVSGARSIKRATRALMRTLRGAPAAEPEGDSSLTNPAQLEGGGGDEFHSNWINLKPTGMSRLLLSNMSARHTVKRRIENYNRLAAGFSGLAGTRLLFPELPDQVVPYELPLWIDDLDNVFPALEDRAVAMHRFGQFLWPGVDKTVCPVTHEFVHNLIQLPCHQELSDTEIDNLISTVQEVLGSRRRGAA